MEVNIFDIKYHRLVKPKHDSSKAQKHPLSQDKNDNQYYNYYATQVMHHYGGQAWIDWNRNMREQLVSTQAKDGHASGSWAPRDPHGGTGGRHYATCLSILTLEVYYRHLPLYRRRYIQAEL